MAQVTLPYTLTPGQPENVTQLTDNLNALVAGINTDNTAQIANNAVTSDKVTALPYAELTQSATAVGASTFVTPDLTSATQDNGVATTGTALADLSNNRIYLRRAGMWLVTAFAKWAANDTGYRWIGIKDSSGNIVSGELNSNFSSLLGTDHSASQLLYTSTNTDYYVPSVFQSSAGNLNCTCTFRAAWLGKFS